MCRVCLRLAGLVFLVLPLAAAAQEPATWMDLMDSPKLEAWKNPSADWTHVGSVELDAKNPRRLTLQKNIVYNGPRGRANNLITKEEFQDVEVHVEFLVPKGSNSGVKLMGLYEIQILDSYGVKNLTGNDCGGIYPRAEDTPRYHYLDKGVPPRINAARPAGEWQSLDILFLAPRFDATGKKSSPARFVKVIHNGQVIHEGVDVEYPTGTAWRQKKEIAKGPLLLQGDHGPVAFRNVRIRPYAGVGPGITDKK